MQYAGSMSSITSQVVRLESSQIKSSRSIHVPMFGFQSNGENMSKSKMCGFINWNYLGKIFLAMLGLLVFCEFIIYYIVLLRCSWPQLNEDNADPNVLNSYTYKPLKVMILSDVHLLGNKRGHWFDKLRREWQMHRAFQTVMGIHNPDVVFFLGDVFDEGLWADEKEFRHYIHHFRTLFKPPDKTKVFAVAGNHDIGFHYEMTNYLHDRFAKALNAPSVYTVTLNGNIFVLVNSIAMHGDDCKLCHAAEEKLLEISKKLYCTKQQNGKCESFKDVPSQTRPILLQHMPLYRESDRECTDPDSAPPWDKVIPFRETWECLSKDATNKLVKWLNPRLVVDGHTHHSCHRLHANKIPEWTVSSFSWRNKNNPSFLLVSVTPNNFAISKCFLPQESTVIMIYMIGIIALIFWIIATRRRLLKLSPYSKLS